MIGICFYYTFNGHNFGEERNATHQILFIITRRINRTVGVASEGKLTEIKLMESNRMEKTDERTFVVKLWSGIFYLLRWISPFQIIRCLFGKKKKSGKPAFVKSYLFVDIWVTANLIMSLLGIYIIKYFDYRILINAIVFYGLLRVFEIFVYQVNVLLFDSYRAEQREEKEAKQLEHNKKKHIEKIPIRYAIRSYRRMVILILENFAEIILWFSSSYLYFSVYFTPNLNEKSILEIVHISFVNMTNFGSADIHPQATLGMQMIWFESIIGLFMTLIVLARFINMLPKPNTLEKTEQEYK